MELTDLNDLRKAIDGMMPEIMLAAIAVIVLIFSFLKSLNRTTFFVTLAGIALYMMMIGLASPFKIVVSSAAIVTIIISGREQKIEFHLLIIFVLLGAALLITSTNYIMILLSMEMISISSYVLTAGTTPDKQRAEAAWKFFIYGSTATAVMIFGMTYMYGETGTLELGSDFRSVLGIIGSLLMLSGFLFKMAAAPFHLWAPDVYESTPAPIVAFLSVAPKLAALYVVIHWMSIPWEGAIAVIALFTIIVGTLAALNQTNSKRMMAWSSVAQAGFLLIIPATNLSPLVYYAVVFAIMNYVVFIVIHQQEQSGRGTSYSDFNGIGYTNPLAAVAITLGLMSLVGIPPVAGFMTKLFVFSNAWSKYANSTSPIFLALFIIGLLTTVASLFFYLKIPFYAFFRRSEEIQPLKISLVTNLLLIILVGTLLALFFAPGLLMAD